MITDQLVLSGWIGLGDGVTDRKLIEPIAQCRQSVNFRVDFYYEFGPVIVRPGYVGQTHIRTFGGLFDAHCDGNLIAWWKWDHPLTLVGDAFPITVVRFAVQQSDHVIAAGSQFGSCNGQPLYAGCDIAAIDGIFAALIQEMQT